MKQAVLNHTKNKPTPLFPFLENSAAKPVHILKGTSIFRAGSFPENIIFLVSGMLRLYKVADDNKEITLGYVRPGRASLFSMLCSSTNSPYPASAMAANDIEGLSLPAAEFTALLNTSHEARSFLFELALDGFEKSIALVEEIAFTPLKKRLARTLMENANGDYNSPIITTHEELSRDLGTSREVISRLLKRYENDEIIKIQRGAIELLNPEALLDSMS